jgi:hypothetical protein
MLWLYTEILTFQIELFSVVSNRPIFQLYQSLHSINFWRFLTNLQINKSINFPKTE